jgi:hypothetical protein
MYWKGFWPGFACCACFYSLRQDLLGKERYIELVKAAWISERITVPLAIAALIAVALSAVLNRTHRP